MVDVAWGAGFVLVAVAAAAVGTAFEVTGAKLLEKTMMQRPGYPGYAARTSMFVPLHPKKG